MPGPMGRRFSSLVLLRSPWGAASLLARRPAWQAEDAVDAAGAGALGASQQIASAGEPAAQNGRKMGTKWAIGVQCVAFRKSQKQGFKRRSFENENRSVDSGVPVRRCCRVFRRGSEYGHLETERG